MRNNVKVISVVLTLVVAFALAYLQVQVMEEYGWTLFVVLPFIIGFLPPFIVGKQCEITRNESYKLSFLTLGIVLAGLLVFAMEGLICIAMALPLIGLLTWSGSYLGYKIHARKWINATNVVIGIISIGTVTMSFDYIHKPDNLIPVTTSIIINAPINEVWENVVTFNEIDEPTDWVFKTGISYPTDATIEGTGVGAIRYCNFTTGSFVEPITVWDEPYLLQFDVVEQPIPMNEYNPFWDIHPPHLYGYFKAYKGQFKLTKIGEHKTELEGTTWYKIDILPEVYWSAWSNFIIHRIHRRVLNHIKTESEE